MTPMKKISKIVMSILIITLAACSGGSGGGKSLKAEIEPKLDIYEPGKMVTIHAYHETGVYEDCSTDCAVTFNGDQMPIVDFMITSDLPSNIKTAKTEDLKKSPQIQIPGSPCEDPKDKSCTAEITIKGSDPITITVANTNGNPAIQCQNTQTLVNGVCIDIIVDPLLCPEGQTLVNNICVENKETSCKENADCPADQECDSKGECVKKVGPILCEKDSDCGANATCETGVCAQKCTKNADCNAAKKEECSMGACIVRECLTDEHCDSGKTCLLGTCIEQKGTKSGIACDAQEDCMSGEACLNKKCAPNIKCAAENTTEKGTNKDCPSDRPLCLSVICVTDEEAKAFFDNVIPDVKTKESKLNPCKSYKGQQICPNGEICVDDLCHPMQACKKGDSCAENETCFDNYCTPGNKCKQDHNCPAGEFCTITYSNGITGFGNCTTEKPQCNFDADCPAGKMCENHSCKEHKQPDGVQCNSHDQCQSNICSNNKCAKYAELNQTSPTPKTELTYLEPLGSPPDEGSTLSYKTNICPHGSAIKAISTNTTYNKYSIGIACTKLENFVNNIDIRDYKSADFDKDKNMSSVSNNEPMHGIRLQNCYNNNCTLGGIAQPISKNNDTYTIDMSKTTWPGGNINIQSLNVADQYDMDPTKQLTKARECFSKEILVGFKTVSETTNSTTVIKQLIPICRAIDNIKVTTYTINDNTTVPPDQGSNVRIYKQYAGIGGDGGTGTRYLCAKNGLVSSLKVWPSADDAYIAGLQIGCADINKLIENNQPGYNNNYIYGSKSETLSTISADNSYAFNKMTGYACSDWFPPNNILCQIQLGSQQYNVNGNNYLYGKPTDTSDTFGNTNPGTKKINPYAQPYNQSININTGCYSNEAIVGFEIRSGMAIDKISPICRNLNGISSDSIDQ
ncbi:MAG: hypothetical protein ACD_73C00792G0006 [uncultured bacterium]|nr:MAG: hypothetical protein ACD_73C00792G0006 [uncultured bacterium]